MFFSEDMSAGRGWIAVVAVMLVRNHPLRASLACVLFGTPAVSVRLRRAHAARADGR
jgi:general nucleoside transport system permease protein